MRRFQNCLDSLELPVLLTQTTSDAHRGSRNSRVEDSIECWMKLNGGAVRHHLVAESDLVFMKAAARA